MASVEISSKAAFFGVKPGPDYFAINRSFFPNGANCKLFPGLDNPEEIDYKDGLVAQLSELVRIVPFPKDISRELRIAAMRDLIFLRDLEMLDVIRGGRKTDLLRPLSEKVAAKVKNDFSGLKSFIEYVESALIHTHLFIRSLKIDDARTSTTQREADIFKPNLHFDGRGRSLEEISQPEFKFFLNAATEPRHFRILPVSVGDMLDFCINQGLIPAGRRNTISVRDLLVIFESHTEIPYETIPVYPNQIAIFDGRTFAHDGGKADPDALLQGEFKPATEPDFAVELGHPLARYHRTYNFSVPLLEDTSEDQSEKYRLEVADSKKR